MILGELGSMVKVPKVNRIIYKVLILNSRMASYRGTRRRTTSCCTPSRSTDTPTPTRRLLVWLDGWFHHFEAVLYGNTYKSVFFFYITNWKGRQQIIYNIICTLPFIHWKRRQQIHFHLICIAVFFFTPKTERDSLPKE